MARRGLGRGLGALIPSVNDKSEKNRVLELSLDNIIPNRNQPRSKFNDSSLDELADSIREFGVLQPIIVRAVDGDEKYEIIAGERRFRAAARIGNKTIPALVISDVDDTSSLEMALIENMHRENLSPMEKAYCYKQLLDEFSITHQDLSKRLGKGRTSISNTLRLLTLPLEVQKLLDEGKISEGHARAILSLEGKENQVKIAQKVVEKGLSVRSVEKLVEKQKGEGHVEENRTSLQFSKIPVISQQLTDYLGSPVKISMSKKKGRIEIGFDTIGDLERVVGKIIG
ncbi:MAG: ParB/RepB/Spo0J family partition protein [Actinobacteria bacterium]|nr:ParB/RepB/Spo0J family partition protein [Actinomycetota bacterium]